VAQVNRLIRDCADDQHVFYTEIGDLLLNSDGLLSAEISPDQLHFTPRGYALLAARASSRSSTACLAPNIETKSPLRERRSASGNCWLTQALRCTSAITRGRCPEFYAKV
jgi:hypothetical protein